MLFREEYKLLNSSLRSFVYEISLDFWKRLHANSWTREENLIKVCISFLVFTRDNQ
jgi:hypothetical protein